MTEQPPKPSVLAIRKNALPQREKRRLRLLGEKRAAAEKKAKARSGKPAQPKPKIAFLPRKKDGVLEAKRLDKPGKPETKLAGADTAQPGGPSQEAK